jgi:hypothetical protein
MAINLNDFVDNYLLKTYVNKFTLLNKSNPVDINKNRNHTDIIISQNCGDGKKIVGKLNSENKTINIKICDSSNEDQEDQNCKNVVEGKMEEDTIQSQLEIINANKKDYYNYLLANQDKIILITETPIDDNIRYEYMTGRLNIQDHQNLELFDEYDYVIKFLISKMLIFSKNNLRKNIKKNDIYFISLTINISSINRAKTMVTEYGHMDTCDSGYASFTEPEINKFCNMSSILYTNIKNENDEQKIYPSAMFFYAPEIPFPIHHEEKQFSQQEIEEYNYISYYEAFKKFIWSSHRDDDKLKIINDIFIEKYYDDDMSYFYIYLIELTQFLNETIPKEIITLLTKKNDKIFLMPAETEEQLLIGFFACIFSDNSNVEKIKNDKHNNYSTIYNLVNNIEDNLLTSFQREKKRFFFSAPMKTSGWAMWKNEASEIQKFNYSSEKYPNKFYNKVKQIIDQSYSNIEMIPYYNYISKSTDFVWHTSPFGTQELNNYTTEKNIQRDFITTRFSNFNIYSCIRFILLPIETLPNNIENRDTIHLDIVNKNIRLLIVYYKSIQKILTHQSEYSISCQYILFQSLKITNTMIERFLTKIYDNLGTLPLPISISINDSSATNEYIQNIPSIYNNLNEKFKNIQNFTNNVYKTFDKDEIVNGCQRDSYSNSFDMLNAFLEEICNRFDHPNDEVILLCDEDQQNNDKKIANYYQKYLKYKEKYLALKKKIK